MRRRKRDKDGLLRTNCENCGAILPCASSSDPVPNCDHCPGHDDIARRDQESEDRQHRGWYVDFELHCSVQILYLDKAADFHSHDSNLDGPYKSFKAAKKRALYLTRWERDKAKEQIREVHAIRKKDCL